jgi:hypothetical protein
MTESWSIVVERIDATCAFDHSPAYLESEPYRRYEVKPYGLLPLTDEEWAAGEFVDVTPMEVSGQRHYLRATQDEVHAHRTSFRLERATS